MSIDLRGLSAKELATLISKAKEQQTRIAKRNNFRFRTAQIDTYTHCLLLFPINNASIATIRYHARWI